MKTKIEWIACTCLCCIYYIGNILINKKRENNHRTVWIKENHQIQFIGNEY